MSKLFSFENFTNNYDDSIFEASTLSKTGLPVSMIKKIHSKAEHRDEKYQSLGHVHVGKRPVAILHKYFQPDYAGEIPAPVVFTGKKVPPPEGSTRTSHYTDFAQYLQDLPNGPLAVLITRPEDEIFLYLYYKKAWGGGPAAGGQQYAIIAWDKAKNFPIDLGFVGLTTEGVEKSLVRTVHQEKGGNTNAKVQEYVNSLAKGAPRVNKPVLAYDFGISTKSRETREERKAARQVMSTDFLTIFAERYKNIVAIMDPAKKEKIKERLTKQNGRAVGIPDSISEFANALRLSPDMCFVGLFDNFAKFRNELFKEGGGSYDRTSGFDLEKESAIGQKMWLYGAYRVDYKHDPKDQRKVAATPREMHLDPEKVRRLLPSAGEYADIPSMIQNNSLDGVFRMFMYYLITGKITGAKLNVLALLGIDPESMDFEGLPDYEQWTM